MTETVIWIAAILKDLLSARQINGYTRPFGGMSPRLYALLAVLGLIVAFHFLTGEHSMSYLARIFPLVNLLGMG